MPAGPRKADAEGKSVTGENVILVTGATGNVGRHVVSQLLGSGTAVRALSRAPDSAGLPAGVDVVRGDLSVPDTMEPALDGVETVVSGLAYAHGRPRR
ncbi:MAG: NAD(P)H-binding protein [Streptosporangiales bacterium]|nr:NAD(P)H-binding protein [Streptosporangiales bacterium]